VFQPKQNSKTAVKHFSCFNQSQSVSAIYATLYNQINQSNFNNKKHG